MTEKWQQYFQLNTSELRLISKYSGLNFNEVLDLQYSDYLLYKKDAWIDSWNKTEEGREFLKNLWRLQQTEADDEAVEQFQMEGGKV